MGVYYNGEGFRHHQPGDEIEITIDNYEDLAQLPSVVLYDRNSNVMFRMVANGSALQAQVRDATDSDWSSPVTLASFGPPSGGEGDETETEVYIDELRLSEAGIVNLLDRIALSLEEGGGVGVKWADLVATGHLFS